MTSISINLSKKLTGIALTVFVVGFAYFLQVTVLNHFAFHGAVCNLPLTITILWGCIFGSAAQEISIDEIRSSTAYSVFLHQIVSGSLTGLLVGLYVAALYHSALPIFPLCYPVIGWVAGYVRMRDLNQETLMCIPLTLLATVFAEAIMSWQLTVVGRGDTLMHLSQFVIPEALLNALIAPFIYYPMRRWFDYYHSNPMDS